MTKRIKEHQFPVIELFGPTIQGEGNMCGMITHFLRLGGCDYRCTWCDSMHAVDPKQVKANRTMMNANAISIALEILGASDWVTISGGDPCIHKHLGEVITLLKKNFYVAVETQGSIWQNWLQDIDWVTISPKGPSSGMDTNYDILEKYIMNLTNVCLKIVLFDREDYKYALDIHKRYPRVQMYLQPGTMIHYTEPYQIRGQICEKTAEIIDWVMQGNLQETDNFGPRVKIIPQMHTLIWPTEKTGR